MDDTEKLKQMPLPKSALVTLERSKKSEYVKTEETIFWKSMLGMVIFAVVMFFYTIPWVRNLAVPRYENKAIKTLRSIGSTQLAYQGTNNEKVYGSFSALQADKYIESGYTLGTFIDGYDLQWQVSHPVTTGARGGGLGSNTFTIVAIPKAPFSSRMRTFAISDDQVVRVYDPVSGHEENAIQGWEPIL